MVQGEAAGQGAMVQDVEAGPGDMVQDEGAELIVVVEDKGAGHIGKEQAGTRQHTILKTEPEDNIQAENVTKTGEEGRGQNVRE